MNGSGQQVPYPQPYGQTGASFQQAAPFQQQPEYGSPGYQQYSAGAPPYQNSQFTPPGMSPSQYQPGAAVLPPHSGLQSNTPPLPFQQTQQQQPSRTHTPPQSVMPFASRPPSLPNAPGLPQRPSFGAPQVNAFQMQQLHQGQIAVPTTGAQPAYGTDASQTAATHNAPGAEPNAGAASVDDLISGAAKQADEIAGKPQQAKTSKPEEEREEKVTKKEKSKPTRLVYSESEISPEEKMAKLPRYAFVPDQKGDTVLGDATTASVSGTVKSSEDINNPPA